MDSSANERTIDKIEDASIELLLSQTRPLGLRRRRNLYEAPEFVQRLEAFAEVETGSTVHFECKLKGFPKPTVKWYKNEDEINENDRYIIDVKDQGKHSLSIINTCTTDEATFKCKAENQEGVASTTGYLSIREPKSTSKHHNRDRCVSYPTRLKTIREQYSFEDREEAECKEMWPSPLNEEIDMILMIRRGHTWPFLRNYERMDDDADDTLECEFPDAFDLEQETYLNLDPGRGGEPLSTTKNGPCYDISTDSIDRNHHLLYKNERRSSDIRHLQNIILLIALSTFCASATDISPFIFVGVLGIVSLIYFALCSFF